MFIAHLQSLFYYYFYITIDVWHFTDKEKSVLGIVSYLKYTNICKNTFARLTTLVKQENLETIESLKPREKRHSREKGYILEAVDG